MIKVRTDNGVMIPLSPKLIDKIVHHVCKNLDAEYDTLHALLGLNDPHCAEQIYYWVNTSAMRAEDVDLLWMQISREHRINMCSEMTFCQNLSKEQTLEILQENDHEMIMAVIEALPGDLCKFTRLKPEDARCFLEQLKQHPSLAIRRALLHEDIMGDVEDFTIDECFALGKIRDRHLRKLTAHDIAKLDQCPYELLKYMAENAQFIKDSAVLRLFAEALLEMEYIYYATVLAENKYLPKEILGMLARQDNSHVAAIAKKTLEKLEDDEDVEDEDDEDDDYYDLDDDDDEDDD